MRYPGPWRHTDVSANGVRFHVAEAGAGPLVLLLHGFGQFWWSWRHQLEQLPQLGYRAVAVDLRGYGDSDKPPRGYDAFTLAGDTSGLIRALGEPSAVVVGTGLGGLTAFNTAAVRPQQVRAVIAVNSAHPMSLARMRRPRRAGGYRRLLSRARWPWWPERRLAAGDGAGLERVVRQGAGRAWLASADYEDAIGRMRSAVTHPRGQPRRPRTPPLDLPARRGAPTGCGTARRCCDTPSRPPCCTSAARATGSSRRRCWREAAQYCSGGYLRHVISGVGHYAAEETPGRVTELMADFLQGLDHR